MILLINKLMSAKSKSDFIREIFLVTVFFAGLFSNQISNYKPGSFILKGIVLLLMMTGFLLMLKTDNAKMQSLIYQKNFKLFVILAGTLVFYPFITLIYSVNPVFGLLKSANTLISVLPLVIYSLLLLHTLNTLRLRLMQIFIITAGIILSLIVIFIYPFDHLTIYSFSPKRLSHVTVGRILGLAYITTLLSLIFSDKQKYILFYAIMMIVTGYAAYLTALRSSILGLILILFTGVIIYYRSHLCLRKNLILISSVCVTFLLIILSDQLKFQTSKERIDDLISINIEGGDGGIRSRAFLFNRSLDLIKSNPWIGTGWGGFVTPDVGIINQMTYPHNIFLEVFVEFGIPVGVLFSLLILYLMWKSYHYSKIFFLFILYSLVLALFSKDMSTNGMFCIGLTALVFQSTFKADNFEC